jgi:hypothetical protein
MQCSGMIRGGIDEMEMEFTSSSIRHRIVAWISVVCPQRLLSRCACCSMHRRTFGDTNFEVARKADGTLQTLRPVHKSCGASCFYEFYCTPAGELQPAAVASACAASYPFELQAQTLY